jgi:hypothetical protein
MPAASSELRVANGKEPPLVSYNYSLFAIRYSPIYAASAREPFSAGVIAPEPLISVTSAAE